ncbi:hypothetical protein BaRGS_00023426 [Batillaria attramentaria]|uniref:Uncharacterized protein n=1 Tax=Batillaria attramentaria TaxID=370345 RepID=A0ABD0KE97_9CAEN
MDFRSAGEARSTSSTRFCTVVKFVVSGFISSSPSAQFDVSAVQLQSLCLPVWNQLRNSGIAAFICSFY